MSIFPTVVIAGGFLGAGKTALLLACASRLRERGLRVAMITNDQGEDLVDTRLAEAQGVPADEVRGACFCCRFSDLARAIERMLEFRPDVIFAEPVGSCMDITATVLRPLKAFLGGQLRVAPFTVLVDPARAADMLSPDADPRLAYLFNNQIAEADIVMFTKSDLHEHAAELPGVAAGRLSAHTGAGVDAWLRDVLDSDIAAAAKLLDIDYSAYAAAEAALGWLNWHGTLELKTALVPAAVVGPLLDKIEEHLTRAGAAIAHAKVFDRTRNAWVKASICRNGDEPVAEGDLWARPARTHDLTVNVRARCAPEILEQALSVALEDFSGRITSDRRQSFQPAPPVPEHRFTT
jgi:hypothetical protein